jgi:hypothetical protein
MAGQPPDPSFRPTGPDQARTQGRPAWQQPGYPPPPPEQAYGAQPDPAYQEQAYQNPGQPYEQAGGTSWPGQPSARPRSAADKGFLGSLFDFSFKSFVTPKLIKALYVLLFLWVTFSAIGILVFFAKFGGWQGVLAALIIIDPIFILLSLGICRVILEAFMVMFRIYEETQKIRENTENRA